MYACMATKTISLDLEAYERLREAWKNERESFSKVVKRAVWPAATGTAGDLLAWRKESNLVVDKAVLDHLDACQEADSPANDKWRS